MYEYIERLDTGDNNAVLWKYMDLSKFLYLITKSMLYFARLDQFEDIFEAEVPYANINNIPSYVDLERQKNSYKKLSNFIRVVTYITCFHISSFESAAMWKLYSKDMGIAIQTNTGRLIEALKNEPQKIFIGKVKYIDE